MLFFLCEIQMLFLLFIGLSMIPVKMDKVLVLVVLRLVRCRNFILLKITLNVFLSRVLSCSRSTVSKLSPQSG